MTSTCVIELTPQSSLLLSGISIRKEEEYPLEI